MQSKLYYANGAIYAEIQENLRKYFYENGVKKTIEPYRDGKFHGEVLLYWPDGSLKRRVEFDLGLRHGADQIWNEKGDLIDEARYERGSLVQS